MTSFALVAFMLPYILMLSLRKRLIDPISKRKVHSVAASRLGGASFFPAILFSLLLCISISNPLMPFIGYKLELDTNIMLKILALLMLFIIGIYDDMIGASYKSKFAVQLLAAILVISTGTYIKTMNGVFGIEQLPPYLGIPITLFFYVFVTNAINLIDGIDGLASLLSIMAFTVYGILLFMAGQINDSLIVMAALGALIPFCYNNVRGLRPRNKSKIFMGDTGALVIGAVLGFSAVQMWNAAPISGGSLVSKQIFYLMAYSMLLVPCFDVVRIIIHRHLDHKPLFMPDKNHIHHKFLALGYSQRESLFWIIAMNLAFIILNICLSLFMGFVSIVIIDISLWTIVHMLISKRVKSPNKSPDSSLVASIARTFISIW